MADKKRKTPPGPPKRPHGPWPSVFPPDGHKPPPPGHPPRWNDTEPVIGVRPWENCCDGESECVCVTSGDVVRWDEISSAVVENSATWNQVGGDDSWKTSADNWNSTYQTVEENSAYWTSAYQMVENIDSGRLEDLYDLVSKTSAFLESYQGLRFVATKKEEIQGFGTSGYPLQLSEDVRANLRSLNKLIVDLYENAIIDPQKRKWVSQDQVDELYAWIEDHDKLFWETKPNIEHDGRRPDGVFDQLEKIWKILKSHGGIVYSAGKWISIVNDVISVSGMNPEKWDQVASEVEANSEYWTSAYDIANEALELATSTTDTVASTSAELVDAKNVVQEYSAYWTSGGREEWLYAQNMDYTNYSAYADPKKIYFNFSD